MDIKVYLNFKRRRFLLRQKMSKQLIDDVLDYFISHDSQMLANVNGNNSIETRAKLLREAREQFVIRGIKEQQLNSDD